MLETICVSCWVKISIVLVITIIINLASMLLFASIYKFGFLRLRKKLAAIGFIAFFLFDVALMSVCGYLVLRVYGWTMSFLMDLFRAHHIQSAFISLSKLGFLVAVFLFCVVLHFYRKRKDADTL